MNVPGETSKPGLQLIQTHASGGYGSEYEYDSEAERKRAKRQDLTDKHGKSLPTSSMPSVDDFTEKSSKEERIRHRHHLLSLNAYDRHKRLVNEYFLTHKNAWSGVARDTSRDRNDADIIREEHRFVWSEDDEEDMTWEKDLAKKYYDKLVKEYCIADLSRYKENKIAMRWRIEKEVISGKGQFVCGSKRCEEKHGLKSWEVNFGYIEKGEKKNALVKLRLCCQCSGQLNYHHKRREVKRAKRLKKEASKAARKSSKRSHKKSRKHSAHRDREEGEEEEDDEEEDSIDEAEGGKTDGSTEETSKTSADVWKGPAVTEEERSREDEFEDYLADMLL